jgi:CopG family nickel-responsive transcriptional regulator
MSIATLHVHIDEATCLEVSLLKGQKTDVEHFAGHVIGERGVRYGQLVVLPADIEQGEARPVDRHTTGRHPHHSS